MAPRLIVAVAGLPGSGKSELSRALAGALKATLVVLGDIVREEVRRRGLEPTPENVEAVATELRARWGRGVVARLAEGAIRSAPSDYVVVDGLRSPEELDVLRSIAPTCVVAVHAAPSIRFSRLSSRGRLGEGSLEAFMLRDRKNLEYGVGDVVALADYMVVNESSVDELVKRARELAEAIARGEWRGRCRGRG